MTNYHFVHSLILPLAPPYDCNLERNVSATTGCIVMKFSANIQVQPSSKIILLQCLNFFSKPAKLTSHQTQLYLLFSLKQQILEFKTQSNTK